MLVAGVFVGVWCFGDEVIAECGHGSEDLVHRLVEVVYDAECECDIEVFGGGEFFEVVEVEPFGEENDFVVVVDVTEVEEVCLFFFCAFDHDEGSLELVCEFEGEVAEVGTDVEYGDWSFEALAELSDGLVSGLALANAFISDLSVDDNVLVDFHLCMY